MQPLFVSLFIVLLTGIIHCASNLNLTVCEAKNPLIRPLASLGVAMNQAPLNNTKYCVGEWNSQGTCCVGDSLVKYVLKKQETHRQLLASMVTDILVAGQKISAFEASLSDSEDDPFEDLMKVINTAKDNLLKEQTQCMNTINNMTQHAVCDICSGRSQKFFTYNKYLMKESTCRRILNSCGNSWNLMLQLLKASDTFKNFFAKLNSTANASNATILGNVVKYSSILNLSGYFEECGNFSTCPINKVAPLCEGFVTLVSQSYLSYFKERNKIQGLITRVLSRLENTRAVIKNLTHQIDEIESSNWDGEPNPELAILKRKLYGRKRTLKNEIDQLANHQSDLTALQSAQAAQETRRRLQIEAPGCGPHHSDVMVVPSSYPVDPSPLEIDLFHLDA